MFPCIVLVLFKSPTKFLWKLIIISFNLIQCKPTPHIALCMLCYFNANMDSLKNSLGRQGFYVNWLSNWLYS